MNKVKRSLLFICLLVFGYLFFWPVSMNPVAWKPIEKKLNYSQVNTNGKINRVELIEGVGPEDVAVNSQGEVFVGLKNGDVYRYDLENNQQEHYLNTLGRPLGMHFDQKGKLLIADSKRGLLSVSSQKEINILSSSANGVKFKFTDDVDVAKDGKIYFSDASSKYSSKDVFECFISSEGNGRLLEFDPATKKTKVLLDNLHFANGVAVAQDQKSVLIVESTRYRIKRYWLKGDKKGQAEIFIEGLDAIGDGVSLASDGGYWLAFMSRRSALLDTLANWPFLRKVIGRLPVSLLPKPKLMSRFMYISQDGKKLINFQDQDKPFDIFSISSVQEHEGKLYLGSYKDNAFATINLAEIKK